MFYFIGGPARCGKSTLAKNVRQRIDGQIVSLDGLMNAFQQVATPETHPDLFSKIVDPVTIDDTPEVRIRRYRRRDAEVWRLFLGYAAMAHSLRDSLLAEGSVWPDLAAELPYEHKAAFLVDTSDEHLARLLHIRDSAVHDNWMRQDGYDDAKMAKWAEFNKARSHEIIRLCKLHGYPYFDIADGGIDAAQQRALDYLIGV